MFYFSADKRIAVVGTALGVLFMVISARLFCLQYIDNEEFIKLAKYQQMSKVKLDAKRGDILDRNGKPLAINEYVDSIFADPRKVTDPHLCAQKLAQALNLDEKETCEQLMKNKSFVWIKRKVDRDLSDKLKQLNLPGIYFQEGTKRIYPKAELLSHVIGFVGLDGYGLEGIEASMECELAGEQGWRIISKDAKRREVAHFIPLEKPVRNGNSVELTIDEIIQYIAESELEVAVAKYRPEWAGIIVMRPYTGEILAMATRPTFNPNKFSEYPTDALRNKIICNMFEPGSIFKVVSCSAALNEQAVSYNDSFFCENGAFRIFRHTLHDCHPYGVLTFPQIIAVSSNIGVSKIAMNLGSKRLYNYLCKYGFGEKTGILLNGESGGIVRGLDSWSDLSILAVPMGQEITVTGLQVVKAVSAVANDGMLMQPYIVKRIIAPDGKVLKTFGPQQLQQVISPKTAKLMNEALKLVVKQGTGVMAALPEYTVAGKTGTAQKAENGGYSHSKYVGSFVGYVPADNPEIAIIVIMDEPKGQSYGGVVSAPVFKEVAQKVLKYLEILPEQERIPLSSIETENGRI